MKKNSRLAIVGAVPADWVIKEINIVPGMITTTLDINGKAFEFTQFKGGTDNDGSAKGNAIEVSDYPPSFNGLPRFVGHLPKAQAVKFQELRNREINNSDKTFVLGKRSMVSAPQALSIYHGESPKHGRGRGNYG